MDHSSGSSVDALFVGYENQENLGLRYIMASLEEEGFRTALHPFSADDPGPVIAAARNLAPRLVGFSIIFQYTLEDFAGLASALRRAGVRAHITVGGHFPSLSPREVLRAAPEIDSIVRFEGERTTAELLRNLGNPASWPSILGLAYRQRSRVVVNPPRPVVEDLDSLATPVRGEPREMTRGIRVASVLASRGCFHDCSFCSIRQFYGGASGPLRRARRPHEVADEMKRLYREYGIRLFIFQDDDFAARSHIQREWGYFFLDALDKAGLRGEVRWKISCRVDDIEEKYISLCRDHGLIAVYLGVESGSPAGLLTLNKRVTVDQNLRAVEILKRLGVAFDMGFMLFDPESTVETVRENIAFLRQTTTDGACPANFCKMLPYAGTPIEGCLRRQNRLKGTLSRPDYDFRDPRLDWYALFVLYTFRDRNFDHAGLVERLRLARFDAVLAKVFDAYTEADAYEKQLAALTARANASAFATLEAGLRFIADRREDGILADWPLLEYITRREWAQETEIQRELDHVVAVHNPDLARVWCTPPSRRSPFCETTDTLSRGTMPRE